MGLNHQILNYYLSAWLAGIFTGVTIICGMVLLSSCTSADSASANATVTVGSACTMTATVDTAHTAEIPGGTTKTDIGSTTLNTICNDASGFAIYAVGYSNNEYGNNKMLSGSSYEFNTGTGNSASNWNMKLSQVTTGAYATTIDGGFGSYSAIPSTFTKVAHRDSVTDAVGTNPAVGSSISLTYGAYISSTQNAGTYEGKVKFTLIHPATEVPVQPQTTEAGCIRYYPNGGNVEGTMGCQPITSSDTSATLLASNFSREGYGFAGWSKTHDYSDATGFYGPNEDTTFIAGQYTGNNNGLSLYAHWVKSAGSIQGWTGCSTLASGAVTALTDQRDSETYAIAKLADGKCWMIENLRLESTNSDNSTGVLAQGYGTSSTYGNFSGLADSERFFTNTYTANSLYYSDTQEGTASVDIGTSNYPAYRMPRYDNRNHQASSADRPQNPTFNSNINSTTDAGMYSYGNYYTWHAAIADLTYNGTVNQSTASTSLCPSGWHLPTGGLSYASGNTSGVNVTGDPNTFREFYNLGYTIMGSNMTAYEDMPNNGQSYYSGNTINANGDTATKAFRKYPNNFIYSGYILGSSASRGSNGNYWSSTANSNYRAHYLTVSETNVVPGTNYGINKYYGYSIRCLVSGS